MSDASFLSGIKYARFVISRSADENETAAALIILDDLISNLTLINEPVSLPNNVDRAQIASLEKKSSP